MGIWIHIWCSRLYAGIDDDSTATFRRFYLVGASRGSFDHTDLQWECSEDFGPPQVVSPFFTAGYLGVSPWIQRTLSNTGVDPHVAGVAGAGIGCVLGCSDTSNGHHKILHARRYRAKKSTRQ